MDAVRRNANLLILLCLQALISLKLWHLENWGLGEGLLRLSITCASLVLMVLLWNMLISRLPRRLALILNIFFICGYLMLQGYHWLRHEPLTFLMLYKNGHDLLTPEAVRFVLSNITTLAWAGLIVAALLLVVLQYRYDVFGSFRTPRHYGRSLVILLLANIGLIAATPSVGNEYYELASSFYRYLEPTDYALREDAVYPYLKKVSPDQERNIADDPQRPHVFIVMLESFSAFYMDRIENGQRVTPFMDELKQQGLFVPNFYSASVETSKGQFATLCSVYPAYRANVFTRYPANDFRCLSHILKNSGYTNVFMKAFHSLGFENTGAFVKANAFDHAHGMDGDFVTRAERARYKFGWGIQDNIFYRKTFEYLDELRAQEGPDSRFFVTTMSVTNHMMFDDIPQDQRYIYPDADSHHENYTNSMHLTDRYLREFFKQLEARDWLDNSLVVVTGDNGFPMGQHGNYHNTKTGYNELFKMPLLILWGDELKPAVLDDRSYSQLDIAPTLLDILGIKTTHHFVGQSVFAIDEQSHFVPLIQPFDGTWLSSIRHPYKLMQHQKTGREKLYNIAEDPGETVDLAGTNVVDAELLQRLRRDIETLKYNELLLEEDRIFPSGTGDDFRLRVTELEVDLGDKLPVEFIGRPTGDSRIGATVNYRDGGRGGMKRRALELVAADAEYLPADLLAPGINHLSLVIRHRNQVRHTVNQDVYVHSDKTALIPNLDIQGGQGWGELGINQSVGGRELHIDHRQFEFGLGTHAPSQHVISLDGGFTWFHTRFGLDDESRCGDGAVFEIWGDDERLYKSPATKQGKIRSALVNVRGYEALRLLTHEREAGNCDHTNWVNPVLYR